jgi:tetratricopeptide (TPR) repeat protein
MARRSVTQGSSRRDRRARGRARHKSRIVGRRTLAVVAALVALVAVAAWKLAPEDPDRLRERAEAATRAGDWPTALDRWRALNRTGHARGRTHLAEARACLALDRAAQAERALRRAVDADPTDPEAWRLWLELLRVEGRVAEAHRLGWAAYAAVRPASRREVLRGMTLALLADLPDDLARATLGRWIAADPGDVEARVARLARIAAEPRSGDPDRADRVATLTALLDADPLAVSAREALVVALADAGEPDRGRGVLEAWPADLRDVRYWRLRGRWELDYDRQPARAVASFGHALAELPHDWKTHYRLARALQVSGLPAAARRAAAAVARIREALDPATLGPRLRADLDRLDDPGSLLDLARLCELAGLSRLADAWRQEAASPLARPGGSPGGPS